MKKLLILFALLPLLAACDNIDEDHRFIDMGDVTVERNVLLEEFTGQRCTNCPQAHAIIEQLQEQYGDNLIVVSIHAGSFGIKAPVGLMQQEGDTYASRWDITTYPAGVVDRSGGQTTMDQWAGVIRNDLEKPTDLNLSLEANVSDDGKSIDVYTTMASTESLTGSLQLWVVENGIVASQIDGDTVIRDYVHNNVFRACVNGLWGEEIALPANEVKYASNSVEIQSVWDIDNIYIVGFYYNGSGVVQVEKVKVKGI